MQKGWFSNIQLETQFNNQKLHVLVGFHQVYTWDICTKSLFGSWPSPNPKGGNMCDLHNLLEK
jgi:hypothetical protein